MMGLHRLLGQRRFGDDGMTPGRGAEYKETYGDAPEGLAEWLDGVKEHGYLSD
ncbi:protein of unknown function [Methylococcus capsulatus]|uniref:Uncharacterized protein n=1 Tax=Methylococcus capsulatus TaxID=414 RepID=A0AA35XSS7_METCP|nr:protein of unknown function [Methylococcus capsulatus]